MHLGFFKCALALGLFVGAVGAAFAATPGFERYQVILDRKPFGAPPPAPEPVRPPTPKADSFAKKLRLSMILETDDGSMRVGIVDSTDNKSFMLSVGESTGTGIELISGSFEEGEAVLKKGDEMAVLNIKESTFSEVAPTDQPSRIEAAANRPSSYAERRRARQEQQQREQAQPPPEPKYTGAALEKHLSDYQMEVIRQGLPPLPIPLTPEQDDQLVAEGYLPPVE
jgi:hypothetical protein